MKLIKTDDFSHSLRNKAINLEERSLLITNFHGTEQELDLKEPANCEGFGRIRHFKFRKGDHWPTNPLPIFPAQKALGLSQQSEIRAQVFQNAICNWRCWYCFVDFKLLAGNQKYSSFLDCDKLLDLYLNQENPPRVIDLTGGQPDLTPEWVPWMMEAITKRGLQEKIFLWSDDNLSNEYFWDFLTPEQIKLVRTYPMYARVCCFKGVDPDSFSLNTKAEKSLFERQFKIFRRVHDLGIDLYGYITLTAPTSTNFEQRIPEMFDKLQDIHENVPLRIVPLEVFKFTPTNSRVTAPEEDMLKGQYQAISEWENELRKRFDVDLLTTPITEIRI